MDPYVVEVTRGLGLGGVETLLYQRARYSHHVGHPLPCIVNTHTTQDFFSEPLKELGVMTVDLQTSNRWRSVVRLWKLAAKLPTETIIVAHGPWPAAVLKVRKRLGKLPQRLVEVAHSQSYARLTTVLAYLLNKYADQMIAVSADVANSPTTKNARRLAVVHAGVDRMVIREWITSNVNAPLTMRQEIGLKSTSRVVAMVANLHEYKGIDSAIKAIAQISGDVHLVIVGEGPQRGELESLIRKLDVTDRVHLLGRVKDAWRWTAVADMLVQPSRREGLPVSLIEARVIGVPVVASDAGGISTVLKSDSRSTVLHHVTPVILAHSIEDTLLSTESIFSEYQSRASVENEWGMTRFYREFNEIVRGNVF